ncbi:MAG: methyltransferase domain-containing protein [Ignavibacteria bacterium]|nr:methyltransferase domain-containing protein [Ignavibacteria bacterium]
MPEDKKVLNKEANTKTEPDKQISFDEYIETYKTEIQDSIGFIGQDVDFFIEIKVELLKKLAQKTLGTLSGIKALDIGSGVGLVDRFLKSSIPDLYGVDVESGVVEKARQNNPEVTYNIYDGLKLPFEDNTFDLSFAINVMHHVPPVHWRNFAGEMNRVLKPCGIAAVFEHNPLNPLTRIAVARCEFDRDAVLLNHKTLKGLLKEAKLEIIEDAYIVFFPFKAKFFRSIELGISWLPFGAQHFAAGRKKQ